MEVAEEDMEVQEETVQNILYGHGRNQIVWIFTKLIRLLLPAPLRFSPAPHNFLNSKTELDLLFEKGHPGYRKSGSGSVLRIYQSGFESFFFLDEGVFWKPNSVTDGSRRLFFFNYAFLNLECIFLLRIDGLECFF